MKLDDISIAIISLIRAGAVFRFVYCMVRLQGAEEEQAQYRKRAKNTVLFYIVAESIWQIKAAGVSDAQLYKQAGNSVTVNIVYEIGLRLAEMEAGTLEV